MRIGIITGNEGKVREISKGFEGAGISFFRKEGEFVEVQSDTLEGVVIKGMELFTSDYGDEDWLIKDDSGLFIEALTGFPGVYSAYAKKTIDNEGILSLMERMDNRNAVFKTVIGLHIPGKGLSLFRGECKGTIAEEMRGTEGFGFDSIFIPEFHDRTFAEMDIDEKNTMSHRSRAVGRLVEFLSGL